MPNRLRPCLLLAALALATACSSTGTAYRQAAVSLAGPETPAQDDKRLYLDLIDQMQRQGAYYASLAHVDAYRQRYGDSPALRLRQADGLRETQQEPAAQALYRSLANGPQAAAAWHGLGLIAARAGHAADAETALAKAVQLQPLNTDYLGDLGFARLRAGALGPARAPLAKAAELAPGNVKANANLAVWALLGDDTAMAEQIMQRANLPDAARDEVRRLARQLRLATPAPVAHAAAAAPAAPSVADAGARSEVRVAPSMLERFGTSAPANASTP